jgi:hypothetical protein
MTLPNIVDCPICKATLIAEELPLHNCEAKRFKWFFEGDWFFGTDQGEWVAIHWKNPSDEILHDPDLASLRRRIDRTPKQEVYILDNFRKKSIND